MNTIAGIFIALLIISFFQTDDTDKSLFKRSGMVLYTDYKTGLQYLGTGSGLFTRGNLIPRLDENGKHMKVEQ